MADARAPADRGEQRLGVGHLRHRLGRDEGRDLDSVQASLGQRLHQCRALLERVDPLFDLEALARALLVEMDATGTIAGHALAPQLNLMPSPRAIGIHFSRCFGDKGCGGLGR